MCRNRVPGCFKRHSWWWCRRRRYSEMCYTHTYAIAIVVDLLRASPTSSCCDFKNCGITTILSYTCVCLCACAATFECISLIFISLSLIFFLPVKPENAYKLRNWHRQSDLRSSLVVLHILCVPSASSEACCHWKYFLCFSTEKNENVYAVRANRFSILFIHSIHSVCHYAQ